MTAQPFGKRKTAPPASASSKSPGRTAPAVRPVLVAPSSSTERKTGLALDAGGRPTALLFGSILPELQEDKYEDLTTFFGPNADKFLNVYKMRNKPRGKLNWAAVFLGFVWFFYRKMYLIGALFVVLPIVVGYLIPIGGVSTSVIAGHLGNGLYLREAIRRIKKADELQLTGEERTQYLKRAGGVSVAAGTIAAVFYVGIVVLAVLSHAHKS